MRNYMKERIKETLTVKNLLKSVIAPPPPKQTQINSFKTINITKFAMNLFEIQLQE